MNWLLKRNKQKFWNNYIIKVDETILNNDLIAHGITKFWEDHIALLPENLHIIILFRIKTVEGFMFTMGHLKKLHKDDRDYYISYVQNILSLKSDEYHDLVVEEITCSYGIREGIIDKQERLHDPNSLNADKFKTKFQNYKHWKLPVTINPNKYGKVISKTEQNYVVHITPLTVALISVKSKNKRQENHVEIFKQGDLVLKYTDLMINDTQFIRTIGRNIYQYNVDGTLELFKVFKPSKFITKTKARKNQTNNTKIVTLDIETFIKEQEHIPYLISWFDGKYTESHYLTNYDSPESMISAAIKNLIRSKYNGYKVYIHNLANFDGIFLMKVLIELGNVKPLIHNGKIISIQLTSKNKKVTLHFRDSYQILLSSLRKLGNAFQVDALKGNFPHRFMDTGVDLNYQGPTPDFIFYDDLEHADYKQITSLNWNLRDEAIKYCVNDCVTLHQIMNKFNLIIFDQFGINVNDAVTLPSLTFKIFRTSFLEDNLIASIHGKTYDHITESYTGGSVDMYIPTNPENELVYGYDINSLYPYVMLNYPMPVGKAKYFEGNIFKVDSEAFGFFYCKIIAPDNLLHPIPASAETHVKTEGGIRTMSPLGTKK